MALLNIITKDSTNRSITLRMIDSGDGTPETGVTSATGGLDAWYHREGAAKVSLTESDLSALTDAHSDGGLLHIADGNYRVDFPDAAFATGANYVEVGWGATGMVGIGGTVRLIDANLEDSVRLGLTALPNAAADAAGGLPISDAGGLDLDALDTNVSAILTDTGTTLPDKMLGYFQLVCRNDSAIFTDRSTELGEINNNEGSGAGDYASTDALEATAIAISSVATTQVTHSTTLSAIVTDTNQLQGEWNDGGRLDLILDAILVDTAEIGAAGAGLTEAGGTGDQFTAIVWNASWDAEVQSEVNDALVALHLDHLFAATYDPASKPGAADALLNELIESDGGVSRYTANALEQAPSGGGATTDDEDLPPASSFYFTKASQTTSPHTITRLAGFDGPLQFDFSPDELFGDEVISSNTTPTVARTVGSGADPTVDNVRYDATKKKLMFDLDCSSAAAGTFTITASVTKSGTIYKQGTFILKAAS